MSFSLFRARSESPPTTAPYSRLIYVKLKSGKKFILCSELWTLLPQGDEVVSILEANGLPIFSEVGPLKQQMLATEEQATADGSASGRDVIAITSVGGQS